MRIKTFRRLCFVIKELSLDLDSRFLDLSRSRSRNEVKILFKKLKKKILQIRAEITQETKMD